MNIDNIKPGMYAYAEIFGKKVWGKVGEIEDTFDTYMIELEFISTKVAEVLQNEKNAKKQGVWQTINATPDQVKECLTEEQARQRIVLEAL